MNEIYDTYVIQGGDTLYAISKKYNVNPELLSLINGLNMNDYIYENQKILIPKAGYSYYLTNDGDDLNEVMKLMKSNFQEFNSINKSILLDGGQLFAYKRI